MLKIVATGSVFLLFFFSGCKEAINSIAVPVNNATVDLNQSSQTIHMPLGLFPETGFKFKGTGLTMEQNF